MKKVFLGGTCNDSTWRDELIPLLEANKIEYFNPVVEDWTPECMEEEKRQKKICGIHLYVITSEMTGTFSIAEAVDSVWCKDKRCLFQVMPGGFSDGQVKSFFAIAELIIDRGGKAYVGGGYEWILKMIQDFNFKEEIMVKKDLGITEVRDARANITDLVVFGDGDTFKLLCKASSKEQGWMKSTKVCNVPCGCIVQVTTQQKNPDGSYAVAEALTYVPGVKIDTEANPRLLVKDKV